jgi:hypothetical protein
MREGTIDTSSATMIQQAVPTAIEERVVIADEADEYTGAPPELNLDVVRTGAGYGSNVAKTEVGEQVTAFSARIGFPMVGRTTVAPLARSNRYRTRCFRSCD